MLGAEHPAASSRIMDTLSPSLLNKPSPRAEDELPALYVRQSLRVAVPVMAASLFLALLAAERAPRWLLLTWVGAVAVMLFVRWLANQFALRSTHLPILSRMNLLMLVSALTGIVQGQAVQLWPYMDDLSHVVLSMFLLGLCAGSIATEFGYLRVVGAYLLPMLTQLAWLWAQALATPDSPWYRGASGVFLLMVAMYGGLLVILARDTFKLFQESFDSRQKLKLALENAESANRSKTRFLASASHDLRQPIHALSLFSAALEMRPLDQQTREITAQMNMALYSLSTQLDTLLDISKLDAGIVSVNPSNFKLAPFLTRLSEEFQPTALRKNLLLEVRFPEQGICRTDQVLLERILRNLLDNAIKYTDHGRISLSAERQGDYFEIRVRDTGRGIPLAEQQRVFEEFYQLGNPERSRSQGLGLGLSIVKRLVELLQLEISMESAEGQGTCFLLKIATGAALDASAPVSAPKLPSISGLKVLVIDDEEAVREGMRVVLESMGCSVQLAAGSDEAVVMALESAPDVVVADYRLQGTDDGLAALRRLAAIDPGLAAILVSGDTAPGRLREAHNAGLRLLHKPVNIEILSAAIREEVDRERAKLHDS
jgi:signal transduction histidine kinase/CheY-like chemotaxis protein